MWTLINNFLITSKCTKPRAFELFQLIKLKKYNNNHAKKRKKSADLLFPVISNQTQKFYTKPQKSLRWRSTQSKWEINGTKKKKKKLVRRMWRRRLPRRRRPNYVGGRVATVASHSTRLHHRLSVAATVSTAGDVWRVTLAAAAAGAQILNLLLVG